MIRRSPPNPPSHTSGGQLNSGRGSLAAPASFDAIRAHSMGVLLEDAPEEPAAPTVSLQAYRRLAMKNDAALKVAEDAAKAWQRERWIRREMGVFCIVLTIGFSVILWAVTR